MALTIVTLQFHHGGCFVSNPTLRYVNGITSVEKINIDVDELHIMLFHKIAMELGVENVETFGCRVNKKGTFYMLNTNSDVLNFLNGLKSANFVDVYVVHPISIPLVIEEILVLSSTNPNVSSSPQQDNVDVSSSPHKNRANLSSFSQIDRVDVSSSQPFDENENRDLNQNQSPLVEEQAPAPRVEEHSDSDSLYDIDENIDDLSDLEEELLQARQSNIQEQVKEKTARVNLDEIPSDPVDIDAGFEDIYKEKRRRFEGNLGGDDPYFDSSDPGSDISEDEEDSC
uniref:Putative ovule protein n=1 Tax=Solanum chacoense TaxID=4108 RepID=A0A0V0IX52_SOLCH